MRINHIAEFNMKNRIKVTCIMLLLCFISSPLTFPAIITNAEKLFRTSMVAKMETILTMLATMLFEYNICCMKIMYIICIYIYIYIYTYISIILYNVCGRWCLYTLSGGMCLVHLTCSC